MSRFLSNRALLSGLLVLCLGWPWLALAETSFYQVEVSVSGQGGGERERAQRSALVQVLRRLTGLQDVAERPEFESLLEAPSRYVQQFRYEGSSRDLRLHVRFDGISLRRALADAGIAVWADERAPVLLWLAIDRGRDRILAGANEPQVRESVLGTARQLGVSVLLPLLDLEDMARVDTADVWGGFRETLIAASERYRADLIVSGRVYRSGDGQWHGRWSLFGSDRAEWQQSGATLNDVLHAGVAELAARLRPRYARVPSLTRSADTLRIRVSDVVALEAFVDLEAQLNELGGVRAARLERLEGSTADFTLFLEVSPERVLRGLQDHERLRAEEGAAVEEGNHYRLLP